MKLNMKRNMSIMIVAVLLLLGKGLSAAAQKNYTTDEIRAGWAKKTITGIKSGNILPLFTAFNNTWRTAPGTALLKDGTNPNAQDNEYHFVVDTPNGYVSAGELGDDGEDIEACVWKRSNGHKLFAVVYTRYHGLVPHPITLFYDYDATKGTLTPEFNIPLVQFMPSYHDPSVDMVHIQLPQKGKDVVVKEYMMHWQFAINHVYRWNGTEPVWAETTIEHYGKMEKLYNDSYVFENRIQFNKYALIDIDEDDNPELWLFSDNDDYQAIYSITEGHVELAASTYYKTHFSFFPTTSTICAAGSCGTGCFRADYTVMKDSKPLYHFADQQDYNYQKDEMVSSYFKNGQPVKTKEGEQFIKRLGEPQELTPQRHQLTHP